MISFVQIIRERLTMNACWITRLLVKVAGTLKAYLAETIHPAEVARADESLILINSSKATTVSSSCSAIPIGIFIIKNVLVWNN